MELVDVAKSCEKNMENAVTTNRIIGYFLRNIENVKYF